MKGAKIDPALLIAGAFRLTGRKAAQGLSSAGKSGCS
jgi:hypothetical protein